MREVVLKLTPEELGAVRRLDTDVMILDSGSVDMTIDQARLIVDAHRGWWQALFMNHPEIFEDEEHYEVDTVRGIVFVDKE